MMDPKDMPTAGDYAYEEAYGAEQAEKKRARDAAKSREELEKQIVVLRGQVAFLAGYLSRQFWDDGQTMEDVVSLEKIKDNNW